jgi:hypothetical protein
MVKEYLTFLPTKYSRYFAKIYFIIELKHPRENTEKFETKKTVHPEELLSSEIQIIKLINKETVSKVLFYASNFKLAVILYGKEIIWKGEHFLHVGINREELEFNG